MKMFCSRKMLLWAGLAALLAKGGDVSFGRDKESVMLENKASQIEDLWKAGKQHEYYLKAADIVRDITTNSTTKSLNRGAATLFADVLSRETNAHEIHSDDLDVTRRLAWLLISNNHASIEECQTNAQLLCRYLGKIRNERIPKFEPKPVVANVAPPAGVPGMAGMDPAAITNPTARAEYEASVRANQKNSLLNSRQSALEKTNKEMGKVIMVYLVRTFVSSPDILRKCMIEAKFSDSEQREVLTRIAGEKGTETGPR